MRNIKNKLDKLEKLFARIGVSKRHELLLVLDGETTEVARARKYPKGVPDGVRLLTIRFE